MLASAAPALTELVLGACSDQEIESVATVFGERLTRFAMRLLLRGLRVRPCGARAAIRLGPRKTGPVLQGLLSGMELFFILC